MVVTLFRPVGQLELDLIETSGWRRFPPRLDWQPIFYPVLNEAYATRIAREWNTKDAENGNVGYVLKFAVDSDYLSRFDTQQVGDEQCVEYWVPAEDLNEFNNHIAGLIQVVSEWRPDSRGPVKPSDTERVEDESLRYVDPGSVLGEDWSYSDIEEVIASGDVSQSARAAILVSLYPHDCGESLRICIDLSQHGEPQVRANAVLGFGHLARVCADLDLEALRESFQAALDDPELVVRQNAETAHEYIIQFKGKTLFESPGGGGFFGDVPPQTAL